MNRWSRSFLGLVALAAVAGCAGSLLAQTPPVTGQVPVNATVPGASTTRPDGAHPAVARIIVPISGGMAFGSGTLVGANDTHGLVITNWHVVRDANDTILVVFPDGFRSAAIVLKTDRVWDLAALAIWRPGIQPVPVSPYPARRGDPLTIAGYGSGWYRSSTGQCLRYVAPEVNTPHELIELSTSARQGDSGGPIFNQKGEIAGVLFGTADGTTTGSYGGRVRAFLESTLPDFKRLNPPTAALAAQLRPPSVPVPAATTVKDPPSNVASAPPKEKPSNGPPIASIGTPSTDKPERKPDVKPAPREMPATETGPIGGLPRATPESRPATLPPKPKPSSSPSANTQSRTNPPPLPRPAPTETARNVTPTPPIVPTPAPQANVTAAPPGQDAAATGKPLAEPSLGDQLKTALAFIGGAFVLFQVMKAFASAEPPKKKK